MEDVGSAAALLLAACLAWAGAAKLITTEAVATQFAALGVPAPSVAARLVPPVELAIGAGLIIAPRPSAIAALVMLAAFSALLGGAVRAGITTGCGCFGARRSDPVSIVDLARNAMLALLAIGAATATTVEVPTLAATITVTTAALVGLLALALLRLRRDVGAVWAVPVTDSTPPGAPTANRESHP